jgi:Ca-activated chloride channel family protein
MARAQGKPPAPQPADKGPKPQETPAQRERRIANEAWLRRVPDDPGGLLRAKFKLEEKRRRREDDR